MSSIRTLIKEKRIEKKYTMKELAEKVGVSEATVSRWESGEIANMKRDGIMKLSEVLDIPPSVILGIQDDKSLEGVTNLIRPSVKPVPILGNICAGNGVWCEDNFDGYFFIDNSVKADMCLKVKGDSMTEAGIDDGDYAFIKETYDYINGRIYAVRINDNCDAVLKKITIQEETIILSPCNEGYEPILKRLDEVSIIGECIGTYHAI